MQLLSLLKELSLHPKNAEELKGLILQLAVQGKLTNLWRDKNGYNINQWKKTVLGDQIELTMGQAPPGSECNKEGIGTPFVKVGQFSRIRPEINEWTTKPLKLVTDKHVLICVVGATIGKINLGINCSIGRSVAGLLPNEKKLIQDYLYCFLLTWVEKFRSSARGSAQGVINKGQLNSVEFSRPPLEEQKAIVEVVNQLFAEVEQLEELTKERVSLKEDFVTSALSRLTSSENTASEWNFLKDQFSTFFTETSNVQQLRETILQLAVQGKLTAKWRANNPNIEPASELLKRIEAEKQQLIKEKKIKKEKPLPAIGDDEIPYELPEGWVWCRLGNIATIGSSKRVFESDYVSTGIPFYRSKEIGDFSRGHEAISKLYISKEKYNELTSKYEGPKAGDLLITSVGSIGNTWIADDREFYYKDGNITQISRSKFFDMKYMQRFVQSPVFMDEVMGKISGTAYNALTIVKLKTNCFPLPPLEEQQAIVEKVNTLMALCDELEQQIETSHTQVEQLMQSCLKEVFEN